MAYEPEDEEANENAHIERMNTFRDKYNGEKDLKALVLAMAAAKARKEALEADLKNANAEFDVLRFERVPEVMDEQGIPRISYDGIGRVSLTGDVRVQTIRAGRDNLYAWFRKHKLGDLITNTINSSTLTAWVKRRMKEGKEIPPSELLKVTPITRASITKG